MSCTPGKFDNGSVSSSSVSLLSGTVDPTAGAGVAADRPAIYVRTTDGGMWTKTGAADTAWTRLVTQTFDATVSATRFLAAADSNTAPGFSWQADDNTGIYSEAADTVSIAAGGARYMRVRTAGTEILNAALALANQVLFSASHTAGTLAVNQNDYTPSGTGTAFSLCNSVRQDASAPVTITGLTGGVAGRVLIFQNIGTVNAITLAHESASSTAANRFLCPGNVDYVLNANAAVVLRYDGTSSRYRVIE